MSRLYTFARIYSGFSPQLVGAFSANVTTNVSYSFSVTTGRYFHLFDDRLAGGDHEEFGAAIAAAANAAGAAAGDPGTWDCWLDNETLLFQIAHSSAPSWAWASLSTSLARAVGANTSTLFIGSVGDWTSPNRPWYVLEPAVGAASDPVGPERVRIATSEVGDSGRRKRVRRSVPEETYDFELQAEQEDIVLEHAASSTVPFTYERLFLHARAHEPILFVDDATDFHLDGGAASYRDKVAFAAKLRDPRGFSPYMPRGEFAEYNVPFRTWVVDKPRAADYGDAILLGSLEGGGGDLGAPDVYGSTLLRYGDGTFARSTEALEGLELADGEEATYRGVDVLRVEQIVRAPDDRPLFDLEGGITNLIQEPTDFLAWSTIGSPSVTGGLADPVGGTEAFAVADDSSGSEGSPEGVFNTALGLAGSTTHVASFWVRKDSPSPYLSVWVDNNSVGTFALLDLTLDIAAGVTTEFTLTGAYTDVDHGADDQGDWWRVWIRFTTAADHTQANLWIFPAARSRYTTGNTGSLTRSVTVWGAQVEAGAFASSPRRASAARGGDQLSFTSGAVPAAMLSGSYAFVLRPTHSSADVVFDGLDRTLFSHGAGSNNRVLIVRSGTDAKVRVVVGGVTKVDSNALVFDRGQPLLVTLDAAAGTVEVEGASSGDGQVVGTAWTMPSGTLYVAARESFTLPYFGMMGEPFAPDDARTERYASGTFARASLASWPSTPEAGERVRWSGAGAIRAALGQFAAGGWHPYFVLEGAGKNWVPWSEDFSAWTASSVTVTADCMIAPDAELDADLLTFSSGSGSVRRAFSGTSNDDFVTVSVWARAETATRAFTLRVLKRDGTEISSGTLTATKDWQRFTFTTNVGTGATTPELRIVNAGSSTAQIGVWGAQAEVREFATSYTRTGAVAADRAADDLEVSVGAWIDSTWVFAMRPGWAAGEALGAEAYLFAMNGSADAIRFSAAGDRLQVLAGGVVVLDTGAVFGFTRDEDVRVIVDPVAGELTIDGALAGDGTYSGTPWAWGAATMQVGADSSVARPFYGMLTEPVEL